MDFVSAVKTFVVGILVSVTTVVAPIATPLSQQTPVPTVKASPVSTIINQQSDQTSSPLPLTGENYIYVKGIYSYFGQSIKYFLIVPRNGGSFSGSIEGACQAQVGGNYAGGNGGEISGRASGTCNIVFVKYQGSINFKGNLYPEEKKLVVELENAHLPPITLNYN